MKSFLIFLHHSNYVQSVLNSSISRSRGEDFQRFNAFLQYNNKSPTLTQNPYSGAMKFTILKKTFSRIITMYLVNGLNTLEQRRGDSKN